MTQAKEQPIEDQWDGTDIEPGHPRNVEAPADDQETYFKSYQEGDLFS